jgi:hypothetical protein
MLDEAGTVVRTVLVGEQPGRPGLTPDGSTVYVPALTGDNVTEIDTATGNILSTVAGNDNSPAAVAITPDGTLGLVANSATASVSFFTPRQADNVGSSGPGGGGGAGPTTSAPGAPSTTVSASSETQSGANELANTGSDPLPVALLGFVVFGVGVLTLALERRARRRRALGAIT